MRGLFAPSLQHDESFSDRNGLSALHIQAMQMKAESDRDFLDIASSWEAIVNLYQREVKDVWAELQEVRN